MTYFLYTPATKTNGLKKNEMVMTKHIEAVAHGIIASTNGSIAPHLFFIAIREETVAAPTRQNANATKVIQLISKDDTDTLRVIPLKAATYSVLKESGLIDLLPIGLFNSLQGQIMFKRSVCEQVVKTAARPN